MTPKFNLDNFENLKNNEIILECEFCHKLFNSTKKIIRRVLGITKHPRKTTLRYCSRKCFGESSRRRINCLCLLCGKEVVRFPKDIQKSPNVFCSRSCSATYSNRNKKFGTNRSKMEIWIEEEIKKIFNLDIKFNDRETCDGNELDIYVPEIKLAFELNGIFHYEAIFGNDKLKITNNKDIKKIIECDNKGIELIVINTSDSKKFDKIKDRKYLEFIITKINSKIDSKNKI